jgi:hypothetical protein
LSSRTGTISPCHSPDYEVEVFYDANEQHRILASDVEHYLQPIYQSEARFVVVLIGPAYPKKIWTKFESDQFKDRLGQDSVVPVWFSDAPPGMFDRTRSVGGLTIDRSKPLGARIDAVAGLLVKRLGETRATAAAAQSPSNLADQGSETRGG